MALSRKSKTALLAMCMSSLLAGCGAEYMNNWDRVSGRAGNATDANTAIQEITAWPPHADNTTIVFGG